MGSCGILQESCRNFMQDSCKIPQDLARSCRGARKKDLFLQDLARAFLLGSSYPDKVFVRQLIHDLQLGCNIGYTGPQFTHLAINLPSAHQQPMLLTQHLRKSVKLDAFLDLFKSPPLKIFCTSGLGVIPKHDGGWRIIYHLSPPDGHSQDLV